ncbi:MAG: DUF6090 family protein [Woeseiaceae bacterium]
MSHIRERYVGLYRRWVGEFVVIVLGILAALAVDSWSEDRNNHALEQEYLARIKEDLEWDLLELDEAMRASILQARSATTLLHELDDPLADLVPRFGVDRLEAIDFTIPANEEFDVSLARLVWWVARDRTFVPRRGTYDELLATGRIIVIADSELRASVIGHYALMEDRVAGLAEWSQAPGKSYDELLSVSSGFNAFDFVGIDTPMPILREIDGLPAKLRDVRRVALRHVYYLDSLEQSSRKLLEAMDTYK